MESASAAFQVIPLIWAPVARHIHYFKDLNDNAATLLSEITNLRCKSEDIERDVEAAVVGGRKPTSQVANWLANVHDMGTQVDAIITEFNLRRTTPSNSLHGRVVARYRLGRRVAKTLRNVRQLKDEGAFDQVDARALPPKEFELPNPTCSQSTCKQTQNEVLKSLHDREIGILCVYGMGGVGKTTLMKAINNQLVGTKTFDAMIWVTVSKDLNLVRIQEEIGSKVGLNFQDGEHEWWRRMELYGKLKKMKYLLILDDLWQEIVLEDIGVPRPDGLNGSKVVLTTRFVGISNSMEADIQIKVRTLTKPESWALFHEKAGEVVHLPEILPLAMEVVNECGGLPLAITTVGRAMRGKKKKELWLNAVRALKGSAPEIEGMEPQVFLPLKLSYDHLQDDIIQACFLYCALFPEDCIIDVDELVNYWTMEGLIPDVGSLEDSFNKGYQILERIKDACLLEASHEVDDHVKMHDLIRDLAIWIASSSPSNERPMFLVKAGIGLTEISNSAAWKDAEKISLIKNKISALPMQPDCPNLESLYVRENPLLRSIPNSFFQLMPKLQVLDLSYTWIVSLPMSLASLVNLQALCLRHCESLVDVQPVGQLQEIKFLDLSFTAVPHIPKEFGRLVKLRQLNLSSLARVTSIPSNVISRLSSLEDLRISGTYVNWLKEWWAEALADATLAEVAELKCLSSLEITIQSIDCLASNILRWQWHSLTKFCFYLGRQHLLNPSSCNRQVHIASLTCASLPSGIIMMLNYTEALILENCHWLSGNLRLATNLRNLKELYISKFAGIDCLLNWVELGDDALQCLERMHLNDLPNLKKVFDGQTPRGSLQRLRWLDVQRCGKLKNLLSGSMAEQLDQLEELRVADCEKMTEIIEGEPLSRNELSNLQVLRLGGLVKLTRICNYGVDLSSLQYIAVCDCPKLNKLPSCYRIQKIMGEKEWWEALEWEDGTAKARLLPMFYPSVWVR